MKARFALLPLILILSSCQTAPKSSAPANTTEALKESRRTPRPDNEAILNPRGIDFGKAPDRVAFGADADQDQPQPIWKAIVATDPDLFLVAGGMVEAARQGAQNIGEQYRKLNKVSDYREARQKIPFMAVWGDGEFGTNDGGADAPTKAVARKEFLSYFRYVKDSIPLAREGLYHSKMIGGQVTGKRRKKVQGPTLQVIMLDTRSFRSPLQVHVEDPVNPQRLYDPSNDKTKTMLGDEQWSWLEDQLKKPADFRFVVTPIQLIATQQGFEKWANFPHERERFFNLLRKTKVKNVVIVSGDRHMGSMAKTNIKDWGTLYEVTSSSLNSPVVQNEDDKDYLATAYPKENFGLATIEWSKKRVHLELKDVDGKTFQATDVKFR